MSLLLLAYCFRGKELPILTRVGRKKERKQRNEEIRIVKTTQRKEARKKETEIKSATPGLNKHESILVCKLFCLFIGDVTLCVQVRLVANKENHLNKQDQELPIGRDKFDR